MRKQKRKVTVNTLSENRGIDRRTVKKRLIEAGLFPCEQQPIAKCLAAIRPDASGSSLESAKARLIDCKIRAIERTEKLTGGDVLPVAWFAECVHEAFRDRLSRDVENLFGEADEQLKVLRAPYIKEHTAEQLKQDDVRHDELKTHLFSWLQYFRKSFRISIEQTRNQLFEHLKSGAKETGGKTSFGEIDDYFKTLAGKLSDSCRAELTAALASTKTQFGKLQSPHTKKNYDTTKT